VRARSFTNCLLSCVAYLGLFLLRAQLLGSDAKAATVTIKGVIINVAEAKAVITSDTYLQLVSLPPDGSYSVGTDEAGRWYFKSSLPRTAMPVKGPFSFVCGDLKQGTYIVAIQLMKAPYRAVLQKDGQLLRIQVSKDTGPTLDVGGVTIPPVGRR
jgi:hypothetical protein